MLDDASVADIIGPDAYSCVRIGRPVDSVIAAGIAVPGVRLSGGPITRGKVWVLNRLGGRHRWRVGIVNNGYRLHRLDLWPTTPPPPPQLQRSRRQLASLGLQPSLQVVVSPWRPPRVRPALPDRAQPL